MSGIPAERRPKRPNAGIPRKRFDEDESDEVEGRKETGSAVLNEKRARTGNNDPREGDGNSAQTRGELVLVMDTSEAGCTLEISPAGPSRRDETGGIDVAASATTPASARRSSLVAHRRDFAVWALCVTILPRRLYTALIAYRRGTGRGRRWPGP